MKHSEKYRQKSISDGVNFQKLAYEFAELEAEVERLKKKLAECRVQRFHERGELQKKIHRLEAEDDETQ